MHINKPKLMNFRCFGTDETVLDLDDMTAFIGILSIIASLQSLS